MDLNERINKICNIPDTSAKTINAIFKIGFVTGSTAWGVNTKDSDIDLVIPPHDIINFDKCIQYGKGVYFHTSNSPDGLHYFQTGFQSAYIRSAGKIYNLLFMFTQAYFETWKKATDKMSLLIAENPSIKEHIKDKKHRVELFEKLKQAAKNA